jgi:TRAP-type mannitol/chloroaromatic compound transport system substrate-binding protein
MSDTVGLPSEGTGQEVSRRSFLKKAAVATTAAGAATLGFPMVARARPVVLKMQGAWGAKDIFNEYAVDYVKRVNAMSGGSLKIDYLVSGAVVKSFRVQDAVHKGVLDGGHSVTVYWYGKSKVASLFGTGPVFGQDAHLGLAWIHYGGGQQLYDELIEKLGINTVGFFCIEGLERTQVPHRGSGGQSVSGDGRQGDPASRR